MLLLQQLLLLVLLPAVRAQAEYNPETGSNPAGSAECPCIDPWAALGSGDTRTCRDVTTHRGRHLANPLPPAPTEEPPARSHSLILKRRST